MSSLKSHQTQSPTQQTGKHIPDLSGILPNSGSDTDPDDVNEWDKDSESGTNDLPTRLHRGGLYEITTTLKIRPLIGPPSEPIVEKRVLPTRDSYVL